MVASTPNLLTTGQAAKLCSVTPDTVLKWIKKGRLGAVRTAGGHYRISRDDLERLSLTPGSAASATARPPECYRRRDLRCWEYLSDRGTVREDCRKCIVFRVGASRCFLMAGLEPDVGHARQFCQRSCEDCVYYRRLNGLAANVLVITADEGLIGSLSRAADERVALRFAASGYEASAIMHAFRPAFAVIDECALDQDDRLLNQLAADSRVPGLRIVIAEAPGAKARRRARSRPRGIDPIIGVLEKPFSAQQIAALISSFHEDFPTPEDGNLSLTGRSEPNDCRTEARIRRRFR
ncbi:MAG: helix-turn-helix domain-containing protein [Planctomycetota bacterium]